MPRHNRRGAEPPPIAAGSRSLSEQRTNWRGEDYVVRSVTGAEKVYRCPGCDQEVRAGQPHTVAWPADGERADERRHWHNPCWAARDRRAPGIQRGRSAPRY